MIEKIQKFLKKASEEYYNGNILIPDSVYDSLIEYYRIQDNKVGSSITNGSAEPHYTRMYSLNKYYEDTKSTNPLDGYTDISYSPKLDGAAISILVLPTETQPVFGSV